MGDSAASSSGPGEAAGAAGSERGDARVQPWDRGRDRRTLLVLIVVALGIYLATATYDSFQINDNRAVNLSAWVLGTQGTLELPASWEGGNRWIVEGRDGALYTNRFPGAILWATPFHAVAEVFLQRGEPSRTVFLNFAPGGVAAAVVTALAVGMSFLVFRRLADRRLAVAAAVTLGFATGTWSVSADSRWTHGLTQLTLLIGVLAAADGRHVRAGLGFAAAVLARPHTAVVPATVGTWRSVSTRSLRPTVVIGCVSVLGVVALALYSYWLFGTWVPVAGYDTTRPAGVATTGLVTTLERVAFTLVHPMRGVLIYTPFLLVLLPFVRHGWRIAPPWVRSAAIGGVIYLAVQLRVNDWHGGTGYFGSRLTLETLTLVAPLLLCTWQAVVRHSERLKGACVGLIVVAVLTHTVGATLRSVDPDSVEHWQAELERLCEDNPDLEEC